MNFKFWTWGKPTDPQNSYSSDPLTEEKIVRMLSGGYGVPTSAGMVVNEQTAMRVSTVYRCVSLLAGTIASLPCEIYRKKGEKAEIADDHPAYYLLHNEPNPLMTANTFWKTFVTSALMWGNGYGPIQRTGLGAPSAVLHLPPTSVTVSYSRDYSRLVYDISQRDGSARRLEQSDMLHYPFIGWTDGLGRSPLECAREAVGLAAAAEEFNSRFFSQGNAADIAIEVPGSLTDDQLKRMLEVYKRTRSGVDKQRLPLISMGGGRVTRLDFDAEKSQMVDSRNFQVEDICRFYGVPPHMVGHTTKTTSWGSGIEEMTLGFVKFTLRDILKGLEQEIDRKLLRSARFYCKFNLEALLRGDSKARAEFYKSALGGTQAPGYLTVNEVRALENKEPLPGGDELYVPVSKSSAAQENTNGTV